jgi:hypothetical protein
MLVAQGYAAAVRLLRALFLFKLGFWGGTIASAPEPDSAPTLRLDGFSAFGGVAVGAKPSS